MRSIKLIASVITAALVVVTGAAQAQADPAYPAKPIRLVVPFSPGGPTDLLARTVAEQLTSRLGQPVIVDNKPGAHGIVGVQAAQTAPADGYTLLMASIGTHGINPGLYEKLPYSSARDFVPLGLIGKMPLVLYSGPGLAASSVSDLASQASLRAGGLTYASSGVGGSSHLAAELLKQRLAIQMRHIPYKGIANAQADVIAGHTQMLFDTLTTGVAQVRAGRLTALAVASNTRASQLPNVPTFAELGLSGLEVTAWYGLVAARGTPEAVVGKLQEALVQVMSDGATVSRLQESGVTVDRSLIGAEFGEFMRAEQERWAQVVRTSGIKAE